MAGMHLVVYSDAPIVGGAEVSVGRLLSALSANVEVTVLGTDDRVIHWIAGQRPGTAAVRVRGPRYRLDPLALAAHVRMLRRLRPDVLQLNLITPWSCRYALLAAILVHQRGIVAVEQLPHPSHTPLHRRFKAYSTRRLAAHVAVGEGSAREVERLVGLPTGSVRTIHHGIPDVQLEPVSRPASAFVVGSIGRLDHQKGLDVLVDALPTLDEATVLLVGDGPERGSLLARAQAIGAASRLTITGWRDDARNFLTAFDVFALPSRFEGFPQAVVEAMLAGLPVVATDVGSVSDAIVDGETGLLVRPDDPAALADALLRLRDDPELRARLGRHARDRALERFSLARMAEAYEALYAELA
jgi:glycosyltransferase involved in cell wall biosynthesis